MDFGRTYIEGYLRATKLDSNGNEEWDKEIALFNDNFKNKIMNDFYDLYFSDLVNGNLYGKDASASPSVTTGFTFALATDTDPDITSDNDFSNFVSGITVNKVSVDKYETEKALIYEVKMTASYTGATASDVVTGVSIYYTGASGNCSDGFTAENKLLFKSINPNNNSLFGANGLTLQDTTNITVVYKIRKEK